MFGSGFEKALLVGIALLAAASCGRSRRVYVAQADKSEARVVRIGSFASLTGANAATETDYQRGFESVIEHVNADNARHVHIQLVTYDDQSRPSASVAAVHRLLDEDQVALVVCGRAPSDLAAPPDAVVVCASCPADVPGKVIGLAPSIQERADLLADLVTKTMNMNQVAVLARAGVAADHAAGDAFRSSLKQRGVETGDAFTFTPETIADVLAKLVKDAPQAVLVAMDGNEAALVGRAMRRRAVPSALLLFGAPNLDVLPEADRIAALEGALFPGVYSHGSTGWVVSADLADERYWLARDALGRVHESIEASPTEDAEALRTSLAQTHRGTGLFPTSVTTGAFVGTVILNRR